MSVSECSGLMKVIRTGQQANGSQCHWHMQCNQCHGNGYTAAGSIILGLA